MVAEGQQETKHLQIYGAATRLIKRIDNLDSLINEINPRPSSEKVSGSKHEGPITLGEYLSSEANRLDNAASKLEGLTDELRGMLF